MGESMDVDELLDLMKVFEGKWCRVYFDDGSKTILKILKVSSSGILCQSVFGTKKLMNPMDIKDLEEFSGIIKATGELVQNGVVVSTMKEVT